MRVLLLGAGGMLGRDLVTTAPTGIELVPLTRRDLDITDQSALDERFAATPPDVILNAAAYTAVDRAESDAKEAFRVNAEAVGQIGRLAVKSGARVVHFSTEYVFDGSALEPYREDAATHPLNVYGASKLAGEQELEKSGAEYLIVRTQWLFGVEGQSFPRTMWERARAGKPTRVVDDQWGRPTFTTDLAIAVWDLLARESTGCVHVANSGCTTWYRVAESVFAAQGATRLLAPCATTEFRTAARRPPRAVLSTDRAEHLLGRALSAWTDSLGRFLSILKDK
jgi:dTDP-4-dehydrorhamnose reductase